MSKLPPNYDWRRSPAHLDLLSKFIKPRDPVPVLNWQFLKETIKEPTNDAIDRFVRDGALVRCTLEETLQCIFTAAQLKKMLKDRGLKVSGSKDELVERLLEADRTGMEQVVSRLTILKCSPDALAVIEVYEREKQAAQDRAKQASYMALLRSDVKEAFKIYLSFVRKYLSPELDSNSYEIEQLQAILKSRPQILNHLSPSALKNLQAAVCMGSLWHGESAVDWLPQGFSAQPLGEQVAANYLLRHAELQRELSQFGDYTKKVRIVFDANDIDSCNLCLSLSGKEFEKNTLPDLPFPHCTSERGCQCRLEPVYAETASSSFQIVDGSDEDEASSSDRNQVSDPVLKLKQLKTMLDSGLISQSEYDTKKTEILSQL